MDYDDLLVYALELLRDHEDIRKFYQEQFQHVLVDEYQDTNKIQSDFIDTLAAYHHQVMAVGDDAQSIYSWRGANFENVLTFPQRFPGTREVRIETNYRSTPEILTLANYAISANTRQFPKNLHAVRPAEKFSKPALICLQDASQQANFICQRIEELQEEGIELNEIAVLYRAHFHSMELQMEMTRRQMPFELLSGLRFFEQAHVKDVAVVPQVRAQSRRTSSPSSASPALMPGVGERTGGQALAEARRRAPISPRWSRPPRRPRRGSSGSRRTQQISAPELRGRASEQIQIVIDAIYEDYMKTKFPNFQSRLEDLGQLRAFAQNFERTEEFLAQLALMTNVDGGPSTGRPAERPAVRAAEHDPPGQGPRVEGRLRHHALRRPVPRRALGGDARGRGGGAAALLRRRHPRLRRALPDLSAHARDRLLRRPLAGAVAVHHELSARPGQRVEDQGRAAGVGVKDQYVCAA